MKLSSSASCGCCFCCYCRSWLMMLLMVSSVIHVSPEMLTTETNSNLNNYYEAMTEPAKFNTKLPSRTSRLVTTSPSPSSSLTVDGQKDNNRQDYTTLQSDMATALATIQIPLTRTTLPTKTSAAATKTPTKARTTMIMATATSSTTSSFSPEQIAMTQQSLHKTTPVERAREEVQHYPLHRLTTSHTPALIGDNYDVVIRTTAVTDSTESIETIGDAGTKNVQITVLDGELGSSNNNNRRHNFKYPRIESNASEQHSSPAITRQRTKDVFQSSSSNDNSLRIEDDNKPNYHSNNNDDDDERVQRTNMKQTAAATVSSNQPRTKQYYAKPTRTSSPNAITTNEDNIGSVIKQINKASSNDYPNSHMPTISTTTTAPASSSTSSTTLSSHLQSTDSALAQLKYNQLKRPALLDSATHPLQRHTRQVDEKEQIDKCRQFVDGDAEKNELYSPDFPNVYPKNINCTRIITGLWLLDAFILLDEREQTVFIGLDCDITPKGQIIRLDFRNSFHIEKKEECKFDFLEIRDGQYGFSNLLGRFCGTDFPEEITSKERYLWLHFHSDESIEYNGFTAVYEFIDRTRDAPSSDLNCTIEKDGFEGFINSTDVPQEIRDTVERNKIALDCMWRIHVLSSWKIQVKFMEFKLNKPNDCDANFLDIFPEQTVMPLRVKNFCGSAGEGITSESNILHMRFFAEQAAINSSFSILYTAFRDRLGQNCEKLTEYDCEDNTCIDANLRCNGRDNCKFRWDEEGCKGEDEGQSEHMVIIITVFGLILGGMVITFLVNCVRKIMHDQKIIREHIRQSKESKLDEMGRNSKARSRDNISIVSPRQKHSQTSLQILDDVTNRYYHEMELQAKGNFKEKQPHIMRHDMIVQTSLCSTDDSSTTTEQVPPQTGACDMGCQTRESLFATGSLLRSKSKTPSHAGGQRSVEGAQPPPRFSTFGYDGAQMSATGPPTTAAMAASTLSRRNIHLRQPSIEAEQPPNQGHMTMGPQQQQHRHLHHRPSQEICHHHHQHQQQQQQQQKQTLPRHQHLQDSHHHTQAAPQITTMPATGTTIVTAISTGSSATRARDAAASGGPSGGGSSKNKQNKADESKVFIDIRNSAPDVIIMTSH